MIDLFRPFMAPDAAQRVATVLSYDADGRLYCGEGARVKEFEARFADLCGIDARDVVTTNSGSSALALALHLAGVAGGAVVSTPQTCTATSGAIVNAGARIVWADVDALTGNVTVDTVQRAITSETRAVLAVNWAGRHVSPDGDLLAICRERGIPLIIDAAHGPFSGFADYTCFSFGPIKHLSCGDGGAVVTTRGDHERARLLRWHGLSRESKADFRCEQDITEVGHRWHLNDINAAIGLANIAHAGWVVEQARANAAWYCDWLADLPGVTLPPYDAQCGYWLMGLLAEDRDGLAAYLKARDIASSRAHRRNDEHPAFRAVSTGWPLPGVDAFDGHQLNIPCGWWIGAQEREYIARTIADWALARDRRAA